MRQTYPSENMARRFDSLVETLAPALSSCNTVVADYTLSYGLGIVGTIAEILTLATRPLSKVFLWVKMRTVRVRPAADIQADFDLRSFGPGRDTAGALRQIIVV
jgi:hypothetical protein